MVNKREKAKKTTKSKVSVKKEPQAVAKLKKSLVKKRLEEEVKWETKRGPAFKFDPDLALSLMQQEIERYTQGKVQYYQNIYQDEEGKRIKTIGVAYPTLGKIALQCGVTLETFSQNCVAKKADGSLKNKQLFETYNIFKDLGKVMLIEGGLTGLYNPQIVQFLANVNYGMIPNSKTETTVEVKSMDGIFAELDQIYHQGQARLIDEKQAMLERKRRFDEEQIEDDN